MSLRDQVALAYDDERGLRCLPRCVKRFFRQLLNFLPDESLPSLTERLQRVEQYIEPLCIEAAQGGSGQLQELCHHLDLANSVNQLADQFGVVLPEKPGAAMWLQWGNQLQLRPGDCLIAVGLWWAQPLPIEEFPADMHSIGYILSARALRMLGAAAPAARLLEKFLGLAPGDFADAARLRSVLTRADSPLAGLEANNQALLIESLADTLGFVSGRGHPQAALLLETFLGLVPGDFADAARLRSALTRADSPLAGLEENNQAVLIQSLADALGFVSGRGRLQAALLLETFLGLVLGDFADAARLRSALTRADSPLARLEANNQALLIASLADTLGFVSGRGRPQAALLLETFLGLVPGDFSDAKRLRAALTRADSPLAELQANNCAILIKSLADALGSVAGRGRPQAALLLETFLGLVAGDFSDAKRLRTALTRADGPLALLEANNHASLIQSLADALGFIAGRGYTQAAILLETFLGLVPGEFSDTERLGTALTRADSPLAGLEANNGALLIKSLANALGFIPGRGRLQAVLLLETFLGLASGDFADAARLRSVLSRADSPLARLEANNRAILIKSLADSLGFVPGRGCPQATVLLETFLGLVPGDFSDAERLGTALTRADSPLARLEANNRSNLIKTLADTLGFASWRGHPQAALLLETFLGLVPGDFSDAERLGTALTRADSPLAQLEANNRAILIKSLANALGFVAGREGHAVSLLEVFGGPDFSCFASGDTSIDLSPLNRLNCVQVWLRHAGTVGRPTEATCASAVRFIRTLRNEHLSSQSAVEEFFLHARGLWGEIQRVTLAVIATALPVERPRLEQQLLHWAEQFENRLLFERLLSQGMPAGDGATELTNWEPGRWGLRSPWDEVAVRKRVSQWYPGRRNEIAIPDRSSTDFASPTACCLRQEPSPLQPGGVPVGSPGAHNLARDRSLPELPEWQLHELLPTSAVWIRAYFDGDDRLRWSGWRSTGTDLVRLAGGASAQPQARQRLTLANLAFDLAVERVWLQATADAHLDGFKLATLVRLGQELHQRCLLRTPIDSLLTEAMDGAMRQLREVGLYTLASLGSILLNDDDSTDLASKLELLQLWQTELQGLQAWNRSGKTPKECDEWRRAALDAASHEHLAALQAELDLAPLWDVTGSDFPWSDTDLLLQLPGPALAMPAAWLDLSGEPLFRRVTSTSSVVSLTFRHLAAEEAAKQPTIDPHLLSAHWEEPTDRHDAIGLAYLHHRLHALPRGSESAGEPASRWNVWSLGDDPELQIDHLQRALGGAQRFGVVVLGGHGSALKAGIQLADGHANPDAPRVVWCGEGANLHGVDLLVLVSCAVGRLNQQGDRDVEGMYVQLAGQGARCVVAARWPISDLEAAELTAEFVERYIRGLGAELRPGPFARARAFNGARRALLDHVDSSRRVTFHQASAFELYGLG